jgi:hypothetical protein
MRVRFGRDHCCAAPTTPPGPIGLTATRLDPYDAESRKRPLRSVEIQQLLAGSVLPVSARRPLAGSIAKLRTRYGSLRIEA